MGSRAIRVVAVVVAILGSLIRPGAQSNPDQEAKTRFDNADRLFKDGKYEQALKDLADASTNFSSSEWAGRALVLKAEYNLEVARNFSEARADLDRLKNYPAVAPAAHTLTGRIKLAEDRSSRNISDAIEDFHRAHGYYQQGDFVAEGRYREGDAKRLNGQIDDAIEEFQNLALSDPRSIWTARALLQLATCLTYRNRWQEAFSALQRLRTSFADTPTAGRELQSAISLNTILYRLYIRRPPELSPFKFANRAINVKLEDVSGIAVLPTDTLVIAHKAGLARVDVDGEVLSAIRGQEPTAVAAQRRFDLYAFPFARSETPAFFAQKTLSLGTESGLSLKVPEDPEKPKVEPLDKWKIVERADALAQTWKREWLVADAGAKNIWVFTEAGQYSRPFLRNADNISPSRMAINAFDEIAVLDTDRKTVVVLGRDGRVRKTIESSGPNYKFERPVDIAFDPLGHLYVLDRGKGNVVVFSPQWEPTPRVQTIFTGPAEKDPGSFRKAIAFGVDSRGRMFIFDENAKRLQVYQ